MSVTLSDAPNWLDLPGFLARKGVEMSEIMQAMSEENVDFLGGSLVRGHGTEESDLDGIVVLKGTDEPAVRNIIVKGVRIDIEYLTLEELTFALNRLKSYDPEDPDSSGASLGMNLKRPLRRLIDMMGRIAEGMPSPTTSHGQLPQLIQESNFGFVASSVYWMDAENRYEDALGFLKAGDLMACHLSVVDCTAYAILALLNRHGVYCDRVKWVFHYADRLPQELRPDFKRLILPPQLDRRHLTWALRQDDKLLNAAK